MSSKIILTDSGGLQGESVGLGVKCLILRNNTEWNVTLREFGGSSVLVGNDVENIRIEYKKAIKEEVRNNIPEFWDGKTAERCFKAILNAS